MCVSGTHVVWGEGVGAGGMDTGGMDAGADAGGMDADSTDADEAEPSRVSHDLIILLRAPTLQCVRTIDLCVHDTLTRALLPPCRDAEDLSYEPGPGLSGTTCLKRPDGEELPKPGPPLGEMLSGAPPPAPPAAPRGEPRRARRVAPSKSERPWGLYSPGPTLLAPLSHGRERPPRFLMELAMVGSAVKA